MQCVKIAGEASDQSAWCFSICVRSLKAASRYFSPFILRLSFKSCLPAIAAGVYAGSPESTTPETRVQVPDVTGLALWEARQLLAQSGLRVLDDGADDTVTAQMPSAGAKLRAGGQVMLYTAPQDLPAPAELVCVPDVAGMPIAQAASLLRQRGLEMEMTGTGFAVRQEPASDEYVPEGTVVKVSFEMPTP